MQIVAKIWLVIHHPFRQLQHGRTVSQATRDRTFQTSIDVIRYSRKVECQQQAARWGWLFRSYFQWHSMAFLLAELCTRREGAQVDDAWAVVDDAWPEWQRHSHAKSSPLWKPTRRLYARAHAIRAQERDKRRAFPADGTLGPAPGAPSTFFGAETTPLADGTGGFAFAPGAMNGAPLSAPNLSPDLRSLTTGSSGGSTVDQRTQSMDTSDGSLGSLDATAVSSVNMSDLQQFGGYLPLHPPVPPGADADLDLSQFLGGSDGSGGAAADDLGLFDPQGLGNGLGMTVDDPLFTQDVSMGGDGGAGAAGDPGAGGWPAWDEGLAKVFQAEARQPVPFSTDAMWGG